MTRVWECNEFLEIKKFVAAEVQYLEFTSLPLSSTDARKPHHTRVIIGLGNEGSNAS